MAAPRQKGVTTVTYTCGHTAQFRHSPPRKGEICTCLDCYKEVCVESSQTENVKQAKETALGTGWEDV